MRQNLIIRSTLLPLTLFVLIMIPAKAVMPTRLELMDFWDSGFYAYYTEVVINWSLILISVFFYGWTTSALLRALHGEKPSTREVFTKIRIWLPRSIAIVLLYCVGVMPISLGSQILPYSLYSFLGPIVSGLLITLIFTLPLTVIGSPKPILAAFRDGFRTAAMSVNKWFHWFLLLFFVSGGFVYIWIPQEIAQRFIADANADMHGWMVHFQMLGGYSFSWPWLEDYSRALLAHPPEYVYSILFVVSVLVAAAINIRVAKILFKNGYLPATAADTLVSSEPESIPSSPAYS